jgi:non-ribosomal peptide synthetase component F
VPLHLGADTTAALAAAARQAGVSLMSGLLAVWLAVLHGRSGQRDLVVLTPVAERRSVSAQAVVACLLNTVPIRVRVEPAVPFAALLGAAGSALALAVSHSALPFADLVASRNAGAGDASVSNVMFLHGNVSASGGTIGAVEFTRYPIPIVAAKHDLALLVTPADGRIVAEVEYRSGRVSAAAAERVATRYRELAGALTRDPQRPLRVVLGEPAVD